MQTWTALGIAGLVWLLGLLAWQVPGADRLERDVTLPWLFASRGPRPAPAEALIVSIDSESARRLGLPSRISDWPRSVYARLIKRTAAAGADVIAIDVFFARARLGAGDKQLASAIADAGNVVLFGRMRREVRAVSEAHSDSQVMVDRLYRPYRRFADAAAAVAPFVLPKAPARVDRVWLYHPAAPTLATLPAAALRVQVQGNVCPPPPAATALQRAACDLAAGEPERQLNFYGPPHAVRVLSAADVLLGTVPDLRGKAVFIGHIEKYFPAQLDSFPTVVGREDGLDLSGVEIAATAYLNLLRQEFLHTPRAAVMAGGLAVSALALAGLFLALGVLPALVLAATLAGGVYLAVLLVFSRWNVWLPLVPWLAQVAGALLAAIALRARASGRERAQVVAAFRPYLPAHVVQAVARDASGALASHRSRPIRAVCLISDAAGYAALGERLPARRLHELANRYFATLLEPIHAQQGIVTDIVGDSALALWPLLHAGVGARLRACRAAMDIQAALANFELPGGGRLPTRIGLHLGELVLGPVGAGEHFEYRAIGDVVNTASRIEALNKQLGTQVLASAEVVAGLPDIDCRPIGRFVLAGREQALALYQLTGVAARASTRVLFEEALAAYAAGDVRAALGAFQAVQAADPDDGVTAFYLRALERGDALREDGAIVTVKI
ncbi:MAG: CHASE2 domain-containing protein [Immundisolibacter sp.]|uniref:CHASE2 domain-containing protein n=1 Tax=Immundisolibacter sp. TaxID=1934948 RepID=UPI003D1061E1